MNFFAKTLDKAEKEVYNESIKNETGAAVPRNGKETEMKKIFALMTSLVMAASLAACGEEEVVVDDSVNSSVESSVSSVWRVLLKKADRIPRMAASMCWIYRVWKVLM